MANDTTRVTEVTDGMKFEIGHCRADELSTLTVALDDAFIFGRGRTISLAQRFPIALSPLNLDNILVARVHQEVVSALVIKYFDWLDRTEIWRGAAVGMVWTCASRRRCGIASQLLERAANDIRSAGRDFAVLWTNQIGFYARLGWEQSENGYFGSAASVAVKSIAAQVETLALSDVNIQWVESLRKALLSRRVLRWSDDYLCRPVPAESVKLIALRADSGRQGYMLFGEAGDTIIVYEMLGRADTFGPLWNTAAARGRLVLINDAPGSVSAEWLNQIVPVNWQIQSQAMWQMLSPRAMSAPYRRWHIPYFDRI